MQHLNAAAAAHEGHDRMDDSLPSPGIALAIIQTVFLSETISQMADPSR
jgi:hypothetical protein